eukprot:TRINITY_DN440_c0_g1::TRINITY_DN440_c0_g1_i1::g.2577::m.2577 TRINITY_DN440_c0_g1::TRINITY_DN440_c0_g1_i1::g.2577  ORF type:complete len:1044 (+),score=183.45,sp/Q9QYE6/GOGA5_MOUSE/25.69/1e-20,Golgin_A5/PF09787.4/3.9e+02,Golgin_A5/PF09787.4/1.5e+04,Golgin_A5/PF09787.4/1.5e+04,Golgin_A5/PF09787.4/9e-09,ADIP/PF11559.3/9.6e+03,ADIP/PF11559.3/2e+03,ADIP/PF11559.3/0.0039,ADIP/PF11559.3/1.8e+02,ADIP/PF11559.3/53,ADIP/PF11559.3/3e+03,ADIP/PF11559.3/1.6e+02,ADIP/PF11559.3/73,DUF4200/PF13863.1/3.1e+03,DUF4
MSWLSSSLNYAISSLEKLDSAAAAIAQKPDLPKSADEPQESTTLESNADSSSPWTQDTAASLKEKREQRKMTRELARKKPGLNAQRVGPTLKRQTSDEVKIPPSEGSSMSRHDSEPSFSAINAQPTVKESSPLEHQEPPVPPLPKPAPASSPRAPQLASISQIDSTAPSSSTKVPLLASIGQIDAATIELQHTSPTYTPRSDKDEDLSANGSGKTPTPTSPSSHGYYRDSEGWGDHSEGELSSGKSSYQHIEKRVASHSSMSSWELPTPGDESSRSNGEGSPIISVTSIVSKTLPHALSPAVEQPDGQSKSSSLFLHSEVPLSEPPTGFVELDSQEIEQISSATRMSSPEKEDNRLVDANTAQDDDHTLQNPDSGLPHISTSTPSHAMRSDDVTSAHYAHPNADTTDENEKNENALQKVESFDSETDSHVASVTSDQDLQENPPQKNQENDNNNEQDQNQDSLSDTSFSLHNAPDLATHVADIVQSPIPMFMSVTMDHEHLKRLHILEGELQEAQQTISVLTSQLEESRQESRTSTQNLAKANKRVADLQARMDELKELVKRADREVETRSEKAADLQIENQRLKNDLEEQEEEYELVSAALHNTEKELKLRDASLAEIKKTLKEMEKELAKGVEDRRQLVRQHVEEMEQFRKALQQKDRDVQEAANQSQGLNLEIERLKRECAALMDERDALASSVELVAGQHASAIVSYEEGQGAVADSLESERRAHATTRQQAAERERVLEAEIVELSQRLAVSEREASDRSSQLAMLRTQLLDTEQRLSEAISRAENAQNTLETELTRAQQAVDEANRMRDRGQETEMRLSAELRSLKAALKASEDMVLELRSQMDSPKPVTIRDVNEDLERQVKSMADTLVYKQTMLETMQTEKSALVIKLEAERKKVIDLEKNLNMLKESAEEPEHDLESGLGLVSSSGLRLRSSVAFQALPTEIRGVTPRIIKIAGVVDNLGVTMGHFLRGHAYARVGLLFYLLLLHVWVFFVLALVPVRSVPTISEGVQSLPGPM